jgi:outer membrane protein TolC
LQTQALRREFNVFDTKLPWYAIQLWGLQLNIPILTGGSNMASIKKAQVEVKRYQDMLNTTKSSSELEYRSARNEYEFALNNLTQAKNNIALAEGILEKTNIKFKEGVTTSFDVTQRTNQLVQAQSNYVDAMQKVLAARTRLAKSLNIQ